MKWSSTEIVILTLKTLLVNIAFYLYKYSSQTSILKICLLWVMWSLQSNASALARVIVKKMQRNLGITHLETLVITSLHPEAISYYTFSHNDEDLEKQQERKKSNKTVQVDLAFIICFLLFSFRCLGLLLHYAVCPSSSHLSKFSFSIICILALASRMLPIAISALKKTSTHIQYCSTLDIILSLACCTHSMHFFNPHFNLLAGHKTEDFQQCQYCWSLMTTLWCSNKKYILFKVRRTTEIFLASGRRLTTYELNR